MKEEIISVIIPVFNCEKYIARCLESIINQTYKNLQIIIINDGSKDNSLEICNEYSEKDSRIEVYTKENGGVSSARNLGLEKVKGKYVSFVDADDFLELEMYTKMIENLKNEDIIVCNFNNVYEIGKVSHGLNLPECTMNKEDALKELFLNRYVIGALWNKLFNYNVLKDIKFNTEFSIGEDFLYEFFVISQSRKIKFISDRLYNYYRNNTNVTSMASYTEWKQIIQICDIIEEYIKETNLLEYFKVKKFKCYRLLINKMIKRILDKKELLYLKKLVDEAEEYFELFNKNKEVSVREKLSTLILLKKAKKMIKNKNTNVYLKAYLSNNLGDDLFVYLFTSRYNNQKYYMLSKYKTYNAFPNIKLIKSKFMHKVIRRLSLKNNSYENILMNKSDLIVILGGSMFMEQNNTNNEKYFVGKNKDYYILGSNFGPYKTKEYYNKFLKIFSEAKDVCFRDEYSYSLFKKLPNVRHASDIVFSLNVKNITISNDKKVIISVIDCDKKLEHKYKELYEKRIIEFINLFYKKGFNITLMSFCKDEGDEEAIKSITSKISDVKIKKNMNTYFYKENIEEALNIIGESQIIVGTRFHANILGLVMNKTIIPIAYSDKTINVLKDMNFKGKIFDIRDMDNFDVDSITDEDLNYKLDVSFQKKDAERHFEKLDQVLERKVKND